MGAGVNLSYWIIARETASLSDFAGDGTKGILIWGNQINEGSILPYFPTTNRQDVLRVDYSTGQPALLLEPQRTNLVLKSQSFGVSPWSSGTGVSIIDNNAISPDGILNASRITFSSGGANEFLRQSRAFSSGTVYTLSVYARLVSGNSSMSLDIENALTQSFTITNTWQRYTWTVTPASAYTWFDIQMNGASVIELYGAQIEDKPYATTYIPNYSPSETAARNADGFSIINVYTNGLIGPSGGTWFIQLRNNIAYLRDGQMRIGIGDTATLLSGNSIWLSPPTTSGRYVILKTTGGSNDTLFTQTTDNVKIGIKWNGSTADVFVNGDKVVSATSFTTTVMENLLSTGMTVPTFIEKMELYNTPLSDTELETLTEL
jgi:hypothetical protein